MSGRTDPHLGVYPGIQDVEGVCVCIVVSDVFQGSVDLGLLCGSARANALLGVLEPSRFPMSHLVAAT